MHVHRALLAWAVCLSVLAGAGFYGYGQILRLIPCARPVTYSIGFIDPRFGITREQLSAALAGAADLWESPANKALFQEKPSGGMVVSAIYDYRQEAQRKMKELGLKVDEGKQSYDALRAKHDALSVSFSAKQKEYDALKATFDRKKAEYEALLAQTQARGATPEDEQRLAAMAKDINARVDPLNAKQTALQKTVGELNAVVTVLNGLSRETNRAVDAYNQVGTSLHDEYDAALYTRNVYGEKIDVFAFDDAQELKRLLAHELGHALGLEHVADSGAVMYYLNVSKVPALNGTDIAALKERCGL
jgi:hypothetical protein